MTMQQGARDIKLLKNILCDLLMHTPLCKASFTMQQCTNPAWILRKVQTQDVPHRATRKTRLRKTATYTYIDSWGFIEEV